MAVVLVNGVEYNHSDVVFMLYSAPILGLDSISWDKEQAKEDLFGTGRYAVARTYGQKKFTMKCTIQRKEYERLKLSAPNLDVLDYAPATASITLVNTSNIPSVTKFKFAEISKVSNSSKQGDKGMMVDLEFVVADIIG